MSNFVFVDGEKIFLEPGQKWIPKSVMQDQIGGFMVGMYVTPHESLQVWSKIPEVVQIKRLRYMKYSRRGNEWFPQMELYGREGTWAHINHFQPA